MRFLDSLYKENIFIPNCVYFLKKAIFSPQEMLTELTSEEFFFFFLMDVVF